MRCFRLSNPASETDCLEAFVRTILLLALSSAAFGADKSWLSGLDLAGPASLCAAQEHFLSRFPAASPRQAEGLFDLWHFYDRTVRANQDAVQSLDAGLTGEQSSELAFAFRAKTPAALEAIRARFPMLGQRMAPWLRCGYVITADFDATIMLNPDPLFLRNLENRIQPELQAYIELFLHESPNWLEYDGALAIPWDRLRSRIRRWEAFRKQNRGIAPLVSDIDRQIKVMFEDYLCGTPNRMFLMRMEDCAPMLGIHMSGS